MNKVISYSLWGNNPKYTVGAVRNAELALNIYPDWQSVFFVNETVPQNIINIILGIPQTNVVMIEADNSWANLFWRFMTCCNPTIDVSIFRDTDSRLSLREKYAVDEWLLSDKTFHIMRDHPYHMKPILGGMWGIKYNEKYNIHNLLESFSFQDHYGTDYDFLENLLYPIIKDDKIVHDEFFDKLPFPTPRNGSEFVGDVFDENNNRHPEYYKLIP
jgi:hypothetical protein